MQHSPSVFLIGFMGTGKTSVGRALAARLGLRFLDMDDEIVARVGKPIPRIFAEDGEPAFRALEREVAREISRRPGLVVATGGGVVLNPDNTRDFAREGLVVCLTASLTTILRRVSGDTNRPLLAGGDQEKQRKAAELLERRRPLYEAIPFRIDTDALSVDEVVDRVTELLRTFRGGDLPPPARRYTA